MYLLSNFIFFFMVILNEHNNKTNKRAKSNTKMFSFFQKKTTKGLKERCWLWKKLHPEKEDQKDKHMRDDGAVMRASPVRDLLCALWRGRAVANSPILRLDESTVNAGRQKSRKEIGAMSNTRWHRKKKEGWTKSAVKIMC